MFDACVLPIPSGGQQGVRDCPFSVRPGWHCDHAIGGSSALEAKEVEVRHDTQQGFEHFGSVVHEMSDSEFYAHARLVGALPNEPKVISSDSRRIKESVVAEPVLCVGPGFAAQL